MSKKLMNVFYAIIAIAISISLYDIYCTVLTVDTIHMDEMNPIAKRIILYGKAERSYHGIACLILIKATLLCVISVGTSIFHYSKSNLLKKILFISGTVYLIEHLIVLGVLLW